MFKTKKCLFLNEDLQIRLMEIYVILYNTVYWYKATSMNRSARVSRMFFSEAMTTALTSVKIRHLKASTYIFMVPFGPRFVLSTSCNPLAALIFRANAWAALSTSAFGLSALMADIFAAGIVLRETGVSAHSGPAARANDWHPSCLYESVCLSLRDWGNYYVIKY